MVTILEALFLGIVQGITEWLPVSSSGHLAIAQHFMGLEVPIAFDVMLHVATMVVILGYFRRDIASMLKAAAKGDFRSPDGRMLVLIAVGSVPTAIIGLAFQGVFEGIYMNMAAVGAALIVTGALLVMSRAGHNTSANHGGGITAAKAALVGAFQGLAVAPGISRSGATIGISLFTGISRQRAISFSFLLAIPAILGAMAFKLDELVYSGISLGPLAFGFLASLVVGFLSLKALVSLIMKGRLSWFSVYCFALGILLLIYGI